MNRLFNDIRQATDEYIIDQLREKSYFIKTSEDLDPLMEKIGDARYVLLGEASHGTHEYYTWRTRITKRLILEKGFSFIAVEGDWPDCYQLNRYIKGYPDAGKSAFEVLHNFNRWPTWMWANWEIVALAEWLRNHNLQLPLQDRIGFYGLDVYSLGESLEAILGYLERTDPQAYRIALRASSCFEPFNYDGSEYAHHTQLVPETCENEVIDLLKEIRTKKIDYNTDHETVFSTEQNAYVALHAENYYREMIKGGPLSWNIRDRHMASTLDRLIHFHGDQSKVIVWEHNTHIGDARATDMADQGMVNVGELLSIRNKKGEVFKVGFGSYKGGVIAGRRWGDVMRKINVPEGMKGSWEYLMHKSGARDKLVFLDQWKEDPTFENHIGHRAIGVVYNPEYEQFGNYVPSIMPMRYDAFIYIDKTNPLYPLHIIPNGLMVPDTFPWGL
jgi:erythromycin esterase